MLCFIGRGEEAPSRRASSFIGEEWRASFFTASSLHGCDALLNLSHRDVLHGGNEVKILNRVATWFPIPHSSVKKPNR